MSKKKRKTNNVWSVHPCPECGEHHKGLKGKVGSHGEYIMCPTKSKRVPVDHNNGAVWSLAEKKSVGSSLFNSSGKIEKAHI